MTEWQSLTDTSATLSIGADHRTIGTIGAIGDQFVPMFQDEDAEFPEPFGLYL